MATYKSIKGFKVQTLASDPLASGVAGATWSSGGNMNTARRFTAGFGIQTSAISAGGLTTTQVANSETYNGTNWTETANLNTARESLAGAGTNTAALAFGGEISGVTAVTEEFSVSGGVATIDTE